MQIYGLFALLPLLAAGAPLNNVNISGTKDLTVVASAIVNDASVVVASAIAQASGSININGTPLKLTDVKNIIPGAPTSGTVPTTPSVTLDDLNKYIVSLKSYIC